MRILLLAVLFLFITINSFSQAIKGKIVDIKNQPIAYANIYVPELKSGTTSNIEGYFDLKLPEGEWDVIFQYIGYKTLKKHFKITDNIEEVVISMAPQSINIKEIKVLSSGEDPAYYVMRRAIAMAPYYTKQVSEYDCKLYLKGKGVVTKIPKLFKKKMKKEGVELNKPFILESLNKIHFELPDKLDQEVIAMRSSGDDKDTNPMEMITTNLYNVSDYGIVSPVGRHAFKKYTFKLAGVFEDQGLLINKILVTPRVKSKGTFRGFINIVEGFWNIHSADLKFKMPFTDVIMHQVYSLVDENTWMPTSFDFSMDLSAFGFGIQYVYVASFSEYNVILNSALDHSFKDVINRKVEEDKKILEELTHTKNSHLVTTIPVSQNQGKIESMLEKEDLSNREMYKLERLIEKEAKRTLPPEPLEIKERVKVTGNVIQNDSSFWSVFRPIPLTSDEDVTFLKKDTLVQIHNTPEYQDSIQNSKTKFKVKDVLIGRTYHYGKDSARFKSHFSISGLANLSRVVFNTVDGFKLGLPFSYNLTDTMGRQFTTKVEVAYGFSRKSVDTKFSTYYMFKGENRSWVNLSFGKVTTDFKEENAMGSIQSSFYSLDLEDNFQKFYEKQYLNLKGGWEIINGLRGSVGVQFAKRSPLENHSDFKIINIKNREYTPNIPAIPGIDDWQLGQSRSSSVLFNFVYTPKQRYRFRNHVKYPAGSDCPTFNLSYRKGIPDIIKSDVDYDFMEFNVQQHFKIGFNTFLNYNLTAGKFFNNSILYAPDLKYFNSNDKTFAFSGEANRFYLLDYYEAVSSDSFLEVHVEFNFEKLLLKRLPLFNRTMIREHLFVNYLTSERKTNYLEVGYGLKGILMMIDVNIMSGFENGKYQKTGLKVNVNLN